MSLQIGHVIDGKYRIVRLLGEGGMGAVFEGENTRIHRRVAIKVLHAGVATNADAVQRFEREAQAAGRIGSEHIVEVLDLGNLPDGERYMVMEYLEGQSLADRITSRGRLSPHATAGLVVDMLEGLAAAHDAGIIHRDLKPDNVYLLASRGGKKDFVKLVDFGISKFNAMGSEFSMTRTGSVMGTPYYMSPEQAKGNRDVDHRADLYAVGVILYEAVAGEVPFNAETFNELLFKIVLETPEPLTSRVPTVDAGFDAIVQKAMARDPAMRFLTAREFQGALRDWLQNQPLTPEVTATAGTPAAFDRTMLPGAHLPSHTAAVTQQGQTGALAASPLISSTQQRTNPDLVGAEKAIGPGTQGSWAQTGGGYAQSGAGSKKFVLGGAALAVLLAAGGGLYAFQSSSRVAEDARLSAQAAQAEAEQRDKEHERELLRLEAEKQKAEAERKGAEEARLAAEKARLEAEAAEKKLETEEAAGRPVARPGPSRPSGGSTPPPPPPAGDPKPGGGRVIRTDL